MQTLYQILALLGAAGIIWLLYRSIKGRPEVFSSARLSASFRTMGILGLILIVFVGILVLITKKF